MKSLIDTRAWVCGVVLAAACSKDVIPNTDVEDTAANRSVIQFVENYRHALERRDFGALKTMASARYYDDNGTPQGGDDVDHETLMVNLKSLCQRALDIRYEIRYRRVIIKPDRVYVDYTYTGSFRLPTPPHPADQPPLPAGSPTAPPSAAPVGGESKQESYWSRRIADNRLTLVREQDGFKILSGM